jgi:hypothetical protein
MNFSEDIIIITNIDKYQITFDKGNMILKRKQIKPEINLANYNFTKSKVTECYIEGKKKEKPAYNNILIEIYKLLDSEFILQNTTINVYKGKKTDKGFHYIQELDISFQGISAKVAIKEITTLAKMTGINYKIKITLENNEEIELKN